ncbi:hypothetical protein PF1751_v1c25430 [Pseudomonas simiae]|nr:hypothetical protein PF1751_v1c25430 [Pseudomonas simiae]
MQDLNVFLDEPLNPPDFDQNPTLFNIELQCFERTDIDLEAYSGEEITQ